MPPVSKIGALSNKLGNMGLDYRYNSDGNSSSYSSAGETSRFERSRFPLYVMNDDHNGRSYVDPWDIENYSFLQRQLKDISISDQDFPSTFETNHSDFYYVPLDNNGSPQYQFKRYIDIAPCRDEVGHQSFTDDVHGLMANIDEYDFYNEYFDTNPSFLHKDDLYLDLNNPSRQSERSRFNNQDYHTYTPPSIIKNIPDIYIPNQGTKIERRSSVCFHPASNKNCLIENEVLSPAFNIKDRENQYREREENKKSFVNMKINLNRRKSFHAVSNNPDSMINKLGRRKSVLDRPHLERWKNFRSETLPDHRIKETLETNKPTRRPSEFNRKPPNNGKEGILHSSENKGNRTGLNVSFNNEVLCNGFDSKNDSSSLSDSSLVYIYETTKRRRKMFLPSASTNVLEEEFRYSHPDVQDAFTFDPIGQYLNKPSSRYAMTNYGHLKIDYSCSWNYLDKCIAQRVCL